jgi:hypothetical protein
MEAFIRPLCGVPTTEVIDQVMINGVLVDSCIVHFHCFDLGMYNYFKNIYGQVECAQLEALAFTCLRQLCNIKWVRAHVIKMPSPYRRTAVTISTHINPYQTTSTHLVTLVYLWVCRSSQLAATEIENTLQSRIRCLTFDEADKIRLRVMERPEYPTVRAAFPLLIVRACNCLGMTV